MIKRIAIGGDHAGVGCFVSREGEGPFAEVDFVDVVKQNRGFKAFCMFQKPLHKFRALYTMYI